MERDPPGFEAAVRPLLPALQRHALALMGNVADAEDLVQETLDTAWRKLGTFRGDAAFHTWLHRICARKGIDMLRARKRRAWEDLPPEDALGDPGAGTGFPGGAYGRGGVPETAHEARRDLLDLVERLPPRDRERFFLREVEQWSWDEIGAMSGASAAACRTAHCRVLARLRKEYGHGTDR